MFKPSMAMAAGWGGEASSLSPAGESAEGVATFFWWMAGAAAVIWAVVVVLSLYAGMRQAKQPMGDVAAERLVLWAGAIIPTVVIFALLVYGLAILPHVTRASPEGALRISVSGEQWWWRMHYQLDDGRTVALANELWLPVGEPAELVLDSPDVVHSLWIPALAGKMDMIPGRKTRLRIDPKKMGVYRGVCAEFCGTSHALMAFVVKVVSKSEFTQWLERQARPAVAPTDAVALRGQDVFHARGCGACHVVRGTDANGAVGPDLTHVGSRATLAAATLETSRGALRRWVAQTHQLKPSVRMPSFQMIPADELESLAAYLEVLQ